MYPGLSVLGVEKIPLPYAPALLLLQDFAYSYRVWITLIKLLYAPLQGTYLDRIFTRVKAYAGCCYLRYCWFPRITLSGHLVNIASVQTVDPKTSMKARSALHKDLRQKVVRAMVVFGFSEPVRTIYTSNHYDLCQEIDT